MNDLKGNKWDVRVRACKKVAVDGQGGIHGSSWSQIKQYQEEFQKEYCHSCFYFDPEEKDFKEKGHPNDSNDCNHHWTDIAGQCWNYHERKAAEAGLAWINEEEERRKSNQVITLSSDPRMVQRLKLKLVEYKGRLEPYKAPEMQMDTLCKIAVLSRLIEKGKVDTLEFMAEMEKAYGSGFNKGYFLSACAIVEDYCLTGGANLHGGSGLPPI